MYNMYKSMFNLKKKKKRNFAIPILLNTKHLKGEVKLKSLNEDLKLQT